MPMGNLSPAFVSSIVSSITKFMKGSNPRNTPVICLFPFSFTEKMMLMENYEETRN